VKGRRPDQEAPDPLTSSPEARRAAPSSTIVTALMRRAVSQVNCREASHDRMPVALATAVIAPAMHWAHMLA
jgi:hypothetical protein